MWYRSTPKISCLPLAHQQNTRIKQQIVPIPFKYEDRKSCNECVYLFIYSRIWNIFIQHMVCARYGAKFWRWKGVEKHMDSCSK